MEKNLNNETEILKNELIAKQNILIQKQKKIINECLFLNKKMLHYLKTGLIEFFLALIGGVFIGLNIGMRF